mmetsp:Transcript_75970/g.235232  ORF Transcript_75970/g.235232 Transcript_75970/m.235232 type:complete len:590 (+) Transcript_75970:179-1948(+)
MGNHTCPCKATPTLPICRKLGSSCLVPASSSASSSGPGLPQCTVDSWGFNTLDLTGSELGQVAYDLLLRPFEECGGKRSATLQSFVQRLQSEYLPNVFHGFHHAVDVLQMVKMLGGLMPWEALALPAERFGLAVAALAHDVGHPGFSNVFLVEACDELAVRYNDASPLENMHCSKLFEILRMQGAGIFAHFQREEARALRKLVIEAILRTDTAYHSRFTAALDEVYREHPEAFALANSAASEEPSAVLQPGEPQAFALANSAASEGPQASAGSSDAPCRQKLADVIGKETQALLLQALLHIADLAHAARPWKLARSWAVRAQEELFLQGDQEQELGLPVMPHHDRETASLPDWQLGLIHTDVAPLVSAEVRLFRAWRELASALAANVQEWSSELLGEDAVVMRVDARARGARAMLEAAALGHPSCKSPSGWTGEEPCSEPSVNCACEAGVAAVPPLVREVRRWHEQRTDGQHRELVLLYVVYEEAQGARAQGQPVLFRYAMKGEAVAQQQPEAPFSEPAPALKTIDAGCTEIGEKGFNDLLSELLSHQKGVTPTPSEENSKRTSSRSGQGGWRSWVTAVSTLTKEIQRV